MSVTESDVLEVLRAIEMGEIMLTPDRDPQEQFKGDILFSAPDGWKIEVSNWSGEFAGIVEIVLPDGRVLDMEYLDTRMPQVAAYFPDADVAWFAYGMKKIISGYIYVSADKPGRFADAEPGDVISNPGEEPPYIIVDETLADVVVARWPGVLWRAQVIEAIEPQDHRGNYTRSRSVKLLDRVDTHSLFGRHGKAVEDILRVASVLTQAQAQTLTARRHPDARALQSAGYHRWLEQEGQKVAEGRDMSGVVAAGQGRSRSPIGHGLSLIHRGVWDSAQHAAGEAAFDEDEEERWLVEPWSEAAGALMDAGWALGVPDLFDEAEREILLQAWRARVLA